MPEHKYTFAQRRRIHLQAKQKLGMQIKRDGESKREFMRNCIAEMLQGWDAEDESDARDICEMLWLDEQDLYD